MKEINKNINIALIFTIGTSMVFSQFTYASEKLYLRVPITINANREKQILLEVQKREIKERLAELNVIKDKKPEEITAEDKECLVKIAYHFNLFPEYLSKNEDKETMLLYVVGLFILASAELESLDVETADTFLASQAVGQINTQFFAHELGHILYGINVLISEYDTIPKDSDVWRQLGKFIDTAKPNIEEFRAWELILNEWGGFYSLDPKIILALIADLISYVEKIKALQNDITKCITEHKSEIGDSITKYYYRSAKHAESETASILMTLRSLRKSIMESKINSLIDIGETLQEISKPYKDIYEISFQIDSQLPYFYGDPLKLSYILTNLFSNAHYAIFEAERIEGKIIINIHTAQKDGKEFIEIIFSDNGVGIPEEMLKDKRLFKKGETSKGTRGTGMGLYIIDQIIKEYGGSIEARNGSNG